MNILERLLEIERRKTLIEHGVILDESIRAELPELRKEYFSLYDKIQSNIPESIKYAERIEI